MQLIDFIIAICLLVFALLCVLYLGRLILSPILSLLGLFSGGRSSGSSYSAGSRMFGRHRKAVSRLRRVDALIAENRCQDALKQLRRAVVFEVSSGPEGVHAVREHHQNFLSRCLLLAEEMGSRAENIAEVERLFIERAELQKLHLKAVESFKSLKYRREQAGKHVPTWSKADFEQRIGEIKSELSKNENNLQEALKKLFDSLGQPVTENIVYH